MLIQHDDGYLTAYAHVGSISVVRGDRVFLHAGVPGKEEEEVVALDAATGKIVWRESYPRPEFKSVLGTGPRATPTVAGKRLYAMGINGLLTCFDIEDGKRVDGFEGCTRDRVLGFTDNTGVRCKDTVLHTAHLPKAYLFARNANDMKLCVDDDMYDVAQAQ